MPFFPQAYLPESALFQLLSELDTPQPKQRQQPACTRRAQPQSQCQRPQTFTPRFDVLETQSAYHLYGEVPGLQQSDLDIQFTDAQTLTIKGKTERVDPTVAALAPATAAPEPTLSATEQEDSHTDDSSSEKSYTATVEDEYDEADTPLVTPTPPAAAAAVKGKAVESTSQQTPSQTPAQAQAQAAAPSARYWITERRVGSFARSFTFEQRIEQDEVTASLQNGIVSVVVPKSIRSKKVAVRVL